ncbi:kinase-like domain-containing protein [Parasitella parasitica]|nr:kinase-like domain-containing protein [Parasitella parasitica]
MVEALELQNYWAKGKKGFSIVYLAEDDNKQLFAVKKICCKMGKEVAEKAVKEAIITDRLQHKNIIKIEDMCMIKEKDGSKTIYIIMPFYKRGNIQDLIDKCNQQGITIPEKQMLALFRDICTSVKVLATYKNRVGVSIPWAHRDIKPANILLSDDGRTPILMDFGSARPAQIEITDRQTAMKQQDDAAENCSMPYRAPELFDVKSGTSLTEKVDVWSLGCTLFTMAYGESPFEMTINQQGGTMALAVLNRQFNFPSAKKDIYSKKLQDLISWMLNIDPNARPNIDEVISAVDRVISINR